MPYSPRVKSLAYQMDPPCWKSYSGMHPVHKRRMEVRRVETLEAAQLYINVMERISFRVHRRKTEVPMPPMKIAMMLHFATVVGPYPPESDRVSEAYACFVRELLEQGMIERPTREERFAFPGWAYRATDKGVVYVEALKRVPLPVQAQPVWVMPDADQNSRS